MSTNTTRPAAACLHSKEPFDALFACIASRTDLSPIAKLVHATLVSQHRTGRAWTQTQMGERLGLSRHQVWRAIDELVAAGAVSVIRYGLGRPNGYILLGIDQADLDGKSPRRPAGHQDAGQSGPQTVHSFKSKERPKNDRVRQAMRRPGAYLETRSGMLATR